MNQLFEPLNAALKSVYPKAQLDVAADKFTRNLLSSRQYIGAPRIDFTFQRLSQIALGSDPGDFALRIGRGLELMEDGSLLIASFLTVGRISIGREPFSWQSERYTAPVGSIQVDALLQKLIDETSEQLQTALRVFVDTAR